MRGIFFCLLVSFTMHACFAQQQEDNVFLKVEIESGTDMKQWNAHLKNNSVLSASSQANIPAGNYKAIVQFIINKDGKLTGVKVKTDPGYGLGKKAAAIVESYKGKWVPANQCGRSVNSYKEQDIVFQSAGK